MPSADHPYALVLLGLLDGILVSEKLNQQH